MGRPKVHPEARRRGLQACDACKSLKRRCDGKHPCSRCSRLRRQSHCRYAPGTDHNAVPPDASPLQLEGEIQDPGRAPETAGSSQCHTVNDWPGARPDIETPTDRMLQSSSGDKLFVGSTAPLSFAQFLRESLISQAATTWQSESGGEHQAETLQATGETMFEGKPSPNGGDITSMRDSGTLQDYSRSFLSACSAILQVLSEDELMDAIAVLAANGDLHTTRHDPAAIYLAIAIGAQSHKRCELDVLYAAAYFHAGRAAGDDPLEMPTLRSATCSVLGAFFMLASHRRNAAYMYLGTAARAAQALGLHQTLTIPRTRDSTSVQKLRLWESICVLDVMISSLLGRLPAIAVPNTPKDSEVASWLELPLEHHDVAFQAAYRASWIIREITMKVSGKAQLSIAEAESYLSRLTSWRNSLPKEIRDIGSVREGENHSAARVIASMNISCSYYHAVILVTRPFLIAARNASGTSKTQDNCQRLASVSVDAAIYMIEAVHQAKTTGLLLPNTCFTKAWVFTAALVLGFAMAINQQTQDEVHRGFDLATAILKEESSVSPHAKQYYGIVDNLRRLIQAVRGRVAARRREQNKCFLDRIVFFPSESVESIIEGSSPNQWEPPPSRQDWDIPMFDETQEVFISGWEDWLWSGDAMLQEPLDPGVDL